MTALSGYTTQPHTHAETAGANLRTMIPTAVSVAKASVRLDQRRSLLRISQR